MSDNGKVKILTKEEILAADDIPTKVVEVPEWGGAVVVHGMSAAERWEWNRKNKAADGSIDIEKAMNYALIIGISEPKFTEEDIPALRKKYGAVLDRISRAWLELSGIGEEELLKARKNS